MARVLSGGFDVGLAFDGDADRVFLVDELGQGMSGSTTTALLATRFLRLNPGATILYNLICSRAVPEIIAEHGGKGIRTKNGHSYMKQITITLPTTTVQTVASLPAWEFLAKCAVQVISCQKFANR
jgi:phosphomannomutase